MSHGEAPQSAEEEERERIHRRVYRARDAARQDVFDYIEMFYTQDVSTSGTACCPPSSSRSSRKSNPRVSTELGAIHCSFHQRPEMV